ncbi:MAG: sugar ABC transporter substrate-binding protein [Eubacteriales bacterium]|nr:sugar ABC transporter substrate-binding protein [Eubacteriales bacterium]
MKRLVNSALILFVLILFCACGGQAAQTSASATPLPTYEENDANGISSRTIIGFSLAGENAFYQQLVLDIEDECISMNYDSQIEVAASAAEQQQDIGTLLSAGVSVIVIDPVDVDALETVLSECETLDVPVINIIDQVNGLVSMLILANYGDMGAAAGQYAIDLFGEGGGCLMLKTDYDSFVMQWMSDGFNTAIGEDSDVSLVSEKFCGDDEDQAYSLTGEALKNDDVDFIFAQSPALARGAMRAIDESGKDIKLVVCGADMDIIESVEAGDIYAAIFFGPGELAKQTVYYADKFIKDNTYESPQYAELVVEAVVSGNAADYYIEDAWHAEVLGQ